MVLVYTPHCKIRMISMLYLVNKFNLILLKKKMVRTTKNTPAHIILGTDIEKSILVMDVEGSDSATRENQKDVYFL